nr:MAG TPA: hypothetical protein [Caudoviricetes sp.]
MYISLTPFKNKPYFTYSVNKSLTILAYPRWFPCVVYFINTF